MIDDGEERTANAAGAGVMNAIGGIALIFMFVIHPGFAIIGVLVTVGLIGLSARQRRREKVFPSPPREPARRPPIGGALLKGLALYAVLIAALIVTAVIAAVIAKVSHSDPAEIFPWVVSGGILSFVVVWAKFWRRPDQQKVAP
jgi:ABC-type Fe3+-siderophore transport system permease subunit